MPKSMIFRFSLYGFLKNQQYFEPFILLAFLQMGLTFTLIGVLIGLREFLRNVAEIPSGAIADILGRRKSLLFSFSCYMVSFAITGTVGLKLAGSSSIYVVFSMLLVAIAFYALADAFRSGTHKALIFTFLRIEGRTDERTKVYGFTRSWSKLGSALSVVAGCIFIYLSDNYILIFYLSIIPFFFNMFNVGTYPKELDGDGRAENASIREIVEHLKASFILAFRTPELRSLIIESMSFEGFFKAMKDYLQPILKMAAIPLAAILFTDLALSNTQKSVILIGPVYFLLYLGSAVANRKAHQFVDWAGGHEPAALKMWIALFVLYTCLVPALFYNIYWAAISGFVFIHLLQNIWRPLFFSRVDSHGDENKGATLLSIQSQAQSIATMIFAPILGYVIDSVRTLGQPNTGEFWPIAILGALIAFLFLRLGKASP